MKLKEFPFYKQPDQMDCGPTCLRMIAKSYGKRFGIRRLREICGTNRAAVSLLGISDAAEKIGLRTAGVKLTYHSLVNSDLPCILHWRQGHFVKLYKSKQEKFYIADPAKGLITYSKNEFLSK